MKINVGDYVKFYNAMSRQYVILEVVKIEKILDSINKEEVNQLIYTLNNCEIRIRECDIKGVYKEIKFEEENDNE